MGQAETIDRSFLNNLREADGQFNAKSLNTWIKESVGDIGTLPRTSISYDELAGKTTTSKLTDAMKTLAAHTPQNDAERELKGKAHDSLRWMAEMMSRAESP